MREKSYKVDTTKLEALSRVYQASRIAKQLNISKQRWHSYKTGENDIPESMLDRICGEFKLNRDELALS